MNSKVQAFKCKISKIVIGDWTRPATSPEDLIAKCYFQKKKLIWEILELNVETGMRLKRKMEMNWDDVLSCRPMIHNTDDTEILEVELRKRPTFLMETNPIQMKPSRWEKTAEDFTLNQSASYCRRHTLHFSSGVLQDMMEKLVSGDNFWKELSTVSFPTLPDSLYFEQDLDTKEDGQIRRHIWNDDGSHMGTISVEDNNENQT